MGNYVKFYSDLAAYKIPKLVLNAMTNAFKIIQSSQVKWGLLYYV